MTTSPKVFRAPQDRQIVDESGQVSEEWHNFLHGVGFTQGAAIPSVAAADTNAKLSTTLNSVLALLRAQGRLKA